MTQAPKKNRPPIINPQILLEGGNPVTVQAARVSAAGLFGPQILLEVTIQAIPGNHTLPIKIGGSNYIALEQRFSDDLFQWNGQVFEIFRDQFSKGKKTYFWARVVGARARFENGE